MPVKDFFNLYRHGFARVAVATPIVRIGDPRHNAEATLDLIEQAAAESTALVVFPELGLTAYTTIFSTSARSSTQPRKRLRG